MQGEKLALRYANSLVDFAKGKSSLDAIKTEIDALSEILTTSKDLQLLVKNPLVHYSKKSSIFDKLFKDKLSKDFLEFLHIIIRKGRENAIYEIIRQFNKLYNQHKGILEVKATFASAPSAALSSELKAALEEKLKGSVTLTTAIDPAVIGGFTVQYKDLMYDASVAGRLNKLKQALKTN